MRSGTLALVGFLGFAAIVGCSKSKAAKCESGFSQMKDFMVPMMEGMAKAFGGDDKGAKKDFGAELDKTKPEFMASCEKLPDDAVDCIADFKAKMMDPVCREKMKAVMPDKKGHGSDGDHPKDTKPAASE